MRVRQQILLLTILILACSMTAHSARTQESCPANYSEEQINLVKHTAWVGLAGDFCPNLERRADAIFKFMPLAWDNFALAEFECKIWKDTAEQAENRAARQLLNDGLKAFCESMIRNYGPSGIAVQGALVFRQ